MLVFEVLTRLTTSITRLIFLIFSSTCFIKKTLVHYPTFFPEICELIKTIQIIKVYHSTTLIHFVLKWHTILYCHGILLVWIIFLAVYNPIDFSQWSSHRVEEVKQQHMPVLMRLYRERWIYCQQNSTGTCSVTFLNHDWKHDNIRLYVISGQNVSMFPSLI
jgi:hypothetical protein